MKLSARMVQQYLDSCERQKKLSSKTIKAYRIDLRQFTEYLSAQKRGYARETIKSYISYMNERYKPCTVKRKIASMKAFNSWLLEEGFLSVNLFTNLRIKIQEPLLLPKTIPLRIVERLLGAAYLKLHNGKQTAGNQIALRDAAVMELLFATGIRVSELCSLRTQDVDLIDGTIRIYGKGSKERIVQITHSQVVAILRDYTGICQSGENDAFFQNRNGTRLSEQSVRLLLQKYAKMIGVSTRITPHMFRHTLATLLLEEDVDIRYIQQLLGHSSIMTTQIYTHVAAAKQRDIMINKHPRNKFFL